MVMIDITKPTILVIARNAWLSGKLASAAREAGVNVKKMFYFRNPPPWSKVRQYKEGASPAQLTVWSRFAEVAHRTKGQPMARRIRTMRAELSTKVKIAPAV